MHSNHEQPEQTQNPTSHTSRGLARYIRRHLAAARRSGDARRIANAEVEIAALRMAGSRTRRADVGQALTN